MAFVEIGQGAVIEVGDNRLAVRFLLHPFIDHKRSEEEGRPIYVDSEMIEIKIPGSRDVLVRSVTEEDKLRYAKMYEHFKTTATEIINGTPLTEFPFITSADRKELEYFNVYSAEQLVGMADGYIDRMRGNMRDLIKKVKAHMENAKDTAFLTKVTQENENLKREIELVKTQMKQLSEHLTEKEDETSRKKKAA